MKIDEKKLKELDRLNLLKVLESASVGNIMRGVLWAGKSLKVFKNYLSELAWQEEEEEEVEEKPKKEKEKEKVKKEDRKESDVAAGKKKS